MVNLNTDIFLEEPPCRHDLYPWQCMPCITCLPPQAGLSYEILPCRRRCWRNENTKWRDETRSRTCSLASPLQGQEGQEAAVAPRPRPPLCCPTVLHTPGRHPWWTYVTHPPTPRRSRVGQLLVLRRKKCFLIVSVGREDWNFTF